jgi:hypothetical protein
MTPMPADDDERERRITELLVAVAIDYRAAIVLAERLEEKTRELRQLTAEKRGKKR